jgi:Immunity protein 50
MLPDPERPVESKLTPRVLGKIHGAEQLIALYGSWPSFHDSEVVSIVLDRGNHMEIIETEDWGGRRPPSLTAQVTLIDWRRNDASTRKYNQLVTLRFNGISSFYMEGFSYQNPVMGIGLRAEPEEGQGDFTLHVEWGGTVMGYEAEFTCESIDVLFVEERSWPAIPTSNR